MDLLFVQAPHIVGQVVLETAGHIRSCGVFPGKVVVRFPLCPTLQPFFILLPRGKWKGTHDAVVPLTGRHVEYGATTSSPGSALEDGLQRSLQKQKKKMELDRNVDGQRAVCAVKLAQLLFRKNARARLR